MLARADNYLAMLKRLMSHVPPGMIEQQLMLVFDVCKTMHGLIKTRKSCHSNTLHLHAILTTLKSLNIWHLKYMSKMEIANKW